MLRRASKTRGAIGGELAARLNQFVPAMLLLAAVLGPLAQDLCREVARAPASEMPACHHAGPSPAPADPAHPGDRERPGCCAACDAYLTPQVDLEPPAPTSAIMAAVEPLRLFPVRHAGREDRARLTLRGPVRYRRPLLI